MNTFYYQKGPVITTENWEFPTRNHVDSFLKQYIPEFIRIFGEYSTYELYFLGSCRDRVLKYPQTYTPEYSHDVDFTIVSTVENPDFNKVLEALCSAVKIGFMNKILIDICFKIKPHYFHSTKYHHDCLKEETTNPSTIYKLNPIIKRVDDYYFEDYLHDSQEYLVPIKAPIPINGKLYQKIQNGWVLHHPTLIHTNHH